MTDYTKLEGADMNHECADSGEKWAAAFLQHHPECNVDEHTLFGWFANAIETAHDHRTGQIINGEHAQYLINRASAKVLRDPSKSKKAMTGAGKSLDQP